MSDPLTIEVRHEQDYVIVTAAGEIDISTVARMRACLFDLAASGRPLVADLDQVSFIDSTGLAALVGTAKRVTCRGGSLYAVCGRPKIRQLFRMTGLDHRIPLASTVDEALQALMATRAHPEAPPT
jgi:anti-sigma B factor antagonist